MKKEYISKCKEYKLVVEQDPYPESPDKWGNEDMFLVYDHRQFDVRRDGFEPETIFKHLQAKEGIKYYDLLMKDGNVLSEQQSDDLDCLKDNYEESFEKYRIFPVAAYIHSGVSLSLTDSFERQGFDTSVTGFVLVEKESLNGESEEANKHLSERYAEGLIETWNQYLSGDVYGYTLYKKDIIYKIGANTFHNLAGTHTMSVDSNFKETLLAVFEEYIDWEEIDSCWGFYGSDIKTNGILEHIDNNIEFEL